MKLKLIVKAMVAIFLVALFIWGSNHQPDFNQLVPFPEGNKSPKTQAKLKSKDQPLKKIDLQSATKPTETSQGDWMLNRFIELNIKALLTKEEATEKEQLLSNPVFFNNCKNTLLSKKPEQFTKEGNAKRFEALFFIEKAIEWEQNPIRSEILQGIEQIIEAPNLTSEIPIDIQRSIAGDKMELYVMLNKVAPDKATNLLSRTRGTYLEKILQYAHKRFSL